ncbi:outer membrane protein [bacterium A37T11]|nr:outer membrane protein [bacterium A37T11]
MFRYPFLVSCLFSLVFIYAGVNAQEAPLPETWSLKACLDYAREHNININNLRLNKSISEQNLIQSKAALLPDLNGSLSQNFSHYNKRSTGGRAIDASGSAGLNSGITLYQGGALRADIKQRNLQVASSDLSVKEAENDLYLQVIEAYNSILLDKETITYAEDLVSTSQQQVIQMQQLFDAGSAARKDLVQIQAQLANDQYTLTAAKNAERQDKINLKQLLQLPVDSGFEVDKPDTSVQLAAISPFHDVLSTALNNRPEVQNSQLNMEIASLDLEKAKAGYRPTLSLNAGLGTSYNNGYGAGSVGNQFDNNFYQQLGITAAIPIFSRKVNQTNKARAGIAVKQAELDLLNTKTLLSQEVEQAYIGTQNAAAQFDAAQQQLKYNEESYRIAKEELQVGSSNTVDFVQQKNLYVQALQGYTQAKYNALLSISVYNFYRGDLTDSY